MCGVTINHCGRYTGPESAPVPLWTVPPLGKDAASVTTTRQAGCLGTLLLALLALVGGPSDQRTEAALWRARWGDGGGVSDIWYFELCTDLSIKN